MVAKDPLPVSIEPKYGTLLGYFSAFSQVVLFLPSFLCASGPSSRSGWTTITCATFPPQVRSPTPTPRLDSRVVTDVKVAQYFAVQSSFQLLPPSADKVQRLDDAQGGIVMDHVQLTKLRSLAIRLASSGDLSEPKTKVLRDIGYRLSEISQTYIASRATQNDAQQSLDQF